MRYLLITLTAILLSTNLSVGQVQNSKDLIATHYNDIVHLFQTQQTDEAKYQIDNALRIYPSDPNFMNLKAFMVVYSGPVNDQKNDKVALALLNKAISFDARLDNVYFAI